MEIPAEQDYDTETIGSPAEGTDPRAGFLVMFLCDSSLFHTSLLLW